MRLPADERRLLAGYYRTIDDVELEEAFEIDELRKALGRWKRYGKRFLSYQESADTQGGATAPSMKKQMRAIKRYISDEKRVRKAARQLALHGLVVLKAHEHVNNVFIVSLTLEGYDLGRRYANWFDRSGLWFEEYRNHWLWLIIAFVGGAIMSNVIQILIAGI